MLQTILSTIIPLIPKIVSGVATVLTPTSGASAPAPTATQTTAATSLLQVEEDFIKRIQTMLNDIEAVGLVSFGGPLVVDGIAGRKTLAALAAVEAKAGSFGFKI